MACYCVTNLITYVIKLMTAARGIMANMQGNRAVRFFGNFLSSLVSWTNYETEVRDLAEWTGQAGMSVAA